ncbi:hypothetical protein [Sphingobacterium daejeonense]|uniref:hypothetical protein n=1 Tax=Sphingobacterium daejeonense TaxID=371142 RepID=UPI0021D0062F|nr:hypothetical protein [Sphingobacterium daejeonense]
MQRPPAGYSADNEHIELLKHRSFILSMNISRKDMESAKALENGYFELCNDDTFQRIYPPSLRSIRQAYFSHAYRGRVFNIFYRLRIAR